MGEGLSLWKWNVGLPSSAEGGCALQDPTLWMAACPSPCLGTELVIPLPRDRAGPTLVVVERGLEEEV